MRSEDRRRKRIGLLVPSSNSIMENDLHSGLSKARYSVHTARMYLVATLREAETEMIEVHAPKAAGDLATVKPDLLVFGCASGGSLGGAQGDRRICDGLGRISGCDAVGALGAINEALDRRSFSRLAVVAPYVDDLTRSVAAAAGTETRQVVAAFGMGISVNAELADPTPEEIIAFAADRLRGLDFDGLLIPCTNFRALEARGVLEQLTGVPVVTSNSAIIEAVESRFPDEPGSAPR